VRGRTEGTLSAHTNQEAQVPGSARQPTQGDNRRPGGEDPTPMPMDSADRLLIYYPEGGPEPVLNPDRNCVVHRVDLAGKVSFERYVPRTRFPFGNGTVEHF
jgi:hypothetical protein